MYVLLLDGAPKGDFNFSFTKKMRQPFCCYMASCLVRKTIQVITFKMSGKMGSNLGQFVFMFSFIKGAFGVMPIAPLDYKCRSDFNHL